MLKFSFEYFIVCTLVFIIKINYHSLNGRQIANNSKINWNVFFNLAFFFKVKLVLKLSRIKKLFLVNFNFSLRNVSENIRFLYNVSTLAESKFTYKILRDEFKSKKFE